MRNKFDEQLHRLDEQLTHMGELCETAIAKATQALKDGSVEQAKIIIEEDEEISSETLAWWNAAAFLNDSFVLVLSSRNTS